MKTPRRRLSILFVGLALLAAGCCRSPEDVVRLAFETDDYETAVSLFVDSPWDSRADWERWRAEERQAGVHDMTVRRVWTLPENKDDAVVFMTVWAKHGRKTFEPPFDRFERPEARPTHVRRVNGDWKIVDGGPFAAVVDDIVENRDRGEEESKTSATRTTISSIETAAMTWETRHFRKPDSLALLLQPDGDREPLLPAKARTDAWGNEIQYRLNGRRMEIRSAGPDGRMNTGDDITN